MNVAGAATIHLGTFSQNNAIRFVDLPSLDAVVYGRDEEVAVLARFFQAQKKHCAVIAPSCFGKTFLLRKFLQHVNSDDKSFAASFDKIIYFNCREIHSVSSVADKFKICLDRQLDSDNLFSHLQNEKILCLFDNFENWAGNAEITAFVHKIFNTNNQLRTIFVAWQMPNDHNFKAEELQLISRKLFKGLDEVAALEFVKAEGKKAKLDQVANNELIRFFEEVSYIPQAIRSMIKFLEIKRKSFDEFIANFKTGFVEFEKSQDRFSDVNDEFRPTLYLLALQIEAQDQRSKDLLSVLAFFESEVPELVIEKFKPEVSAIEKEVIHRLLDNWLVEEIKIYRGKDFRFYSPHLMIRRVVRESLPKFEDKHHAGFESLANELFDVAYSNHDGKHNYEEAINLYQCVEKLLEYLVYSKGRPELANDLAAAYLNKGVALYSLGKLNEAILEYEKAIGIREKLVQQGRGELANELAKAYLNKGVALQGLGKLNEAILEYEKAIAILAPLVQQGRGELANDLAAAYLNKGVALYSLEKPNEAILEYEKAIGIREKLVQQGRGELANDLAMAYLNKGVALRGLGKLNEAIEIYGEAINLWEEMLKAGYAHILPNLAVGLGNRVYTHREAGNADLAKKDMQRLHELLAFTKQQKEIEHLGVSIQAEIDKRS